MNPKIRMNYLFIIPVLVLLLGTACGPEPYDPPPDEANLEPPHFTKEKLIETMELFNKYLQEGSFLKAAHYLPIGRIPDASTLEDKKQEEARQRQVRHIEEALAHAREAHKINDKAIEVFRAIGKVDRLRNIYSNQEVASITSIFGVKEHMCLAMKAEYNGITARIAFGFPTKDAVRILRLDDLKYFEDMNLDDLPQQTDAPPENPSEQTPSASTASEPSETATEDADQASAQPDENKNPDQTAEESATEETPVSPETP